MRVPGYGYRCSGNDSGNARVEGARLGERDVPGVDHLVVLGLQRRRALSLEQLAQRLQLLRGGGGQVSGSEFRYRVSDFGFRVSGFGL